jgi:hypothetical protein
MFAYRCAHRWRSLWKVTDLFDVCSLNLMRMVILGFPHGYVSRLSDIHNTLWLTTVGAEPHYRV